MKRKKLLSIVLAVVLSLCSVPLTAVQAQKSLETFSEEEPLKKNETEEFEKMKPEMTPQEGNVKAASKIGEEYSYAELEDGTLEIMSYFGNDTELVVPTEIDGKRVTRIGHRAFNGCSSLRSIELPESVTSVGRSVFSECSNLKEIIVGGNNVNYTSKDGILYDKNQMELICCPMGKAGDIVIPASVNKIGESAFSGCKSLKSIELPESVNEIGGHAFYGCSSLKSIKLPASLSSMPKGTDEDEDYSVYVPVFSGCSSLKEIIVDENNANYESKDGILYEKGQKYLIYCPQGKVGDIVIPASVNEIGSDAFTGCSSL